MYDRKISLDLNCGISIAMEVIISKWKFHILNKINTGLIRPKDIQTAIPELTKRVLHQQLKQLETYRIVHKTVYSEVPLRTEYTLTEEGHKVLDVLKILNNWGLEYKPQLMEICYQTENKSDQ